MQQEQLSAVCRAALVCRGRQTLRSKRSKNIVLCERSWQDADVQGLQLSEVVHHRASLCGVCERPGYVRDLPWLFAQPLLCQPGVQLFVKVQASLSGRRLEAALLHTI